MRIPAQGATIFGEAFEATIDSPVSPQAIVKTIIADAQATSETLRQKFASGVIKPTTLPLLPHAAPVPVFWTIYNRWTSKYVVDMTGNEHADDANAVTFPSQQAAIQFARSLVGKPITHALVQPPPENEGHCYKCGTQNARGTVTCTRCQKPIDVATSWVQVHAHDAEGRWGGPTVYA